MLKNSSSTVPAVGEVEDIDLALLNGEDLFGMDYSDEDESEGLGAVGTRRRRRRRSAKAARRGRRHGRKMTKSSLKRRARRHAKTMPRNKKGRFIKLSRKSRRRGLHGLSDLADVVLLENEEKDFDGETGLGRRKGRRRKAHRAKASRKGRQRSRRSRRSGMRGIEGLANASASLADVEVSRSLPVVGLFQYAATRGGLEALGGAALAPVVSGLVKRGLFQKILGGDKGGYFNEAGKTGDVLSSLTSAVVVWELGKVVGSGNIAKFGAFSIISGLIERLIVKPFVMPSVGLGYMSDGVLFPNIRRSDYAVNPLSGLGTVRVPDTQSLGQVRLFENQDLVGLGTVRVPDSQGIGTVRVPDTASVATAEDDQEAEVMDGVGEEGSEIF